MPFRKKIQVISLASLLMVSLSGCVIAIGDDDYNNNDGQHSNWESREKNNRAHIQNMVIGTSYLDITNKMGIADFNEVISGNASNYQVLYYRTQRQDSDGVTTKDECTPLVFSNGELIGWGMSFVQSL
ncbi:MAG: DUF3192 domain-containing protein [Glaciecola sp.]|jgi:hypothetical protein|nr:DUF3192 domain-containing protein [Glaciecola sp.]MDG1816330.1 DUF3192 domain-containing protein [Glaciecola sp.]MDG2100242.1 DUF3192 domain-containing protein [Glaciecola sp.]